MYKENKQSLKNEVPKKDDEIQHLKQIIKQTEKQNIVLKKLLTELNPEKFTSNKYESLI